MTSKAKIDPWGSLDIEDYRKLFDEFGIESFAKYKHTLSDNRYVRRDIIFGHRDFGRIMKAIEKREPFVMMTGLMPSGRFHFGHKMVADQIIYYQQLGAQVYVCSADLEAYTMRGMDLPKAREIAVNEYLPSYVALGLDLDKTNFWFQTDYVVPYYRFRDLLSKKVTLNELKGIYGKLSPGKILSVLAQSADILHPQLEEFNGPIPTVVPVGADQDPHIRLTRDLSGRFQLEYNFIPPSSTYHKFMRGLQGGKMSSSEPKSSIALSDKPKDAMRKIMAAKTGGRPTVEEHRKKGGRPEECTVYDLLLYHLVEDDKELKDIYTSCRSGALICGECKAKCGELMAKFLDKHHKRMSKAQNKVKTYLDKRN
ncbi:MAG: tryptophan--tRNA ligase [Candidatus Altiarchaeales archaeon ex4484_2]|nr:MAG: tryptophan--tRNA ligase [Candidatus Altiarchaeales archaeon ex4484_2]